MKYYFDLYNIEYQKKSIKLVDGEYTLVNFYNPDKISYKERINIYNGTLNENISQKIMYYHQLGARITTIKRTCSDTEKFLQLLQKHCQNQQ